MLKGIFVCVCLLFHAVAYAGPQSVPLQFVGVSGSNDAYSHRYWILAVAANGDWFSANVSDSPPIWTPRGNLFAMSGHLAGSQRIVSFMPPWAITQDGDIYSGGGNIGISEYWVYEGNLASLSGHSLNGQEIVALGRSIVGVDWAITSGGDIYGYYYSGGCPNTWCYTGNVVASGPTGSATEAWGALKVRYR